MFKHPLSTSLPAAHPRAQRFGLAYLGLLWAVLGALSGCSAPERSPASGPADVGAGADARATSPPDAGPQGDATLAPDATPATDEPDWDPDALIGREQALGLVNPFIGTGGLGFGYAALTPAAQTPLGLVRLGPDTTQGGNHPQVSHFSGYNVADADVRGFSHLHFVGTGVADYGNLRVLPHGKRLQPGPSRRWFARMDKSREQARPGYYAVYLPEEQVQVELVATSLGARHRYGFDGPGPHFLTLDAGASVTGEGMVASAVEIAGDVVRGHATYAGPYTGRTRPFTLYFSLRLSQRPSAAWTWVEDVFDATQTSAEGRHTGAVLRFDALQGPVELEVGLSMVDAQGAEQNRLAQVHARSLEDLQAQASAAWGDKLGRVRLKAARPEVARIFYSALYNAYRMPTRLSDVDGRYRGLDGEVHEARDFVYYSDLSLWDTFRTLHPWLALTDVEEQRHMLRSLQAMQQDGGYFPRWPAAVSYTGGMLGSWADVLFAEGALKGIDGIDYARAWTGLRELAMAQPPQGHPFRGREHIADYIAHGYVPEEAGAESVSLTLEYAWSDFALANLAQHLGLQDEEALFRERARAYRQVFHAPRGFFLPRRRDGSFATTLDTELVYMGGGPFTEGSAWHFRFYALHDLEGLAELFGGPGPLGEALEAFFQKSRLGRPGAVRTTLPDPYYWHGNEPALHAALVFHAAGRPDRLGHWVRQIQTRLYLDAPEGLPGNDDGGTLSAWYLFNALGLYPVAGSARYLWSVPLVRYAEVDTAQGTLVIEAPGADVHSQHVQGVRLGGAPVTSTGIDHQSLLRGARLQFDLSP